MIATNLPTMVDYLYPFPAQQQYPMDSTDSCTSSISPMFFRSQHPFRQKPSTSHTFPGSPPTRVPSQYLQTHEFLPCSNPCTCQAISGTLCVRLLGTLPHSPPCQTVCQSIINPPHIPCLKPPPPPLLPMRPTSSSTPYPRLHLSPL